MTKLQGAVFHRTSDGWAIILCDRHVLDGPEEQKFESTWVNRELSNWARHCMVRCRDVRITLYFARTISFRHNGERRSL